MEVLYKTESREEQKLSALYSLGVTDQMDLVRKVLNEIALDKECVRPQDISTPLRGIASGNPNPALCRPELWKWWCDNFDTLNEMFSQSLGLFGRVFSLCVGESIGLDFVDSVEKWVAGEIGCSSVEEKNKRKDSIKAIDSNIKQELEKVRSNTMWVERERDNLVNYFTCSREVLPANVTPTNYLVDISPNFDTFKFTGSVAVR